MFVQRINYVGVFACVIIQFVLSQLWYSPWVFSDQWFSLTRTNIESFDALGIKPYIFSLISLIISTYALSYIVMKSNAKRGLSGAKVGFLVWAGFIAPLHFTANTFKGFALELSVIESSIDLINFLIAGSILATWRNRN